MAGNVYGAPIGQDFNAINFNRGFKQVVELGSGKVSDRKGSMLWGKEPDPGGDHWEEAYYTQLLGVARRAESLHDTAPTVQYKMAATVFAGWKKYHVAYSMLKEAAKDELYGITTKMVSSLGEVMEETHELTYMEPWNLGTTFVSGWQNKALFANNLGIIGDEDYVISNILDDLGGPSYQAALALDEYGANFVNQENRPSSRRLTHLFCGRTTAREWESVYSTTMNIEGNATLPAPDLGDKPMITALNRMANSRDTWACFDGWQEQMICMDRYRNQQRTIDIQDPQAVRHIVESRFLFFFRDSRLIVYIPGPAA
jgi:hypothetical protein